MKRLKLFTLVGTRPELIKLSATIGEADKYFDHVLVHTGQNHDYRLNGIFFEQMGIRAPDRHLEIAGGTPAQAIARVIERVDQALEEEKPDAFLLLGDTNSCLGAISAKRRKIPIFHMEAGNRCFDQRVPEEINRRLIDHVSDINLPYTDHARANLLAEGLAPDRIIKTGSPMGEILGRFTNDFAQSAILSSLTLKPKSYVVVSAHREENVDNPARLAALVESLNAIADQRGLTVVVSTHPRTRARLNDLGERPLNQSIHFLEPLGFFDYIHLQQNAACVISDSGTLTEEAAILGFPAIMVREAHERPEGMDVGTVIRANADGSNLLAALDMALAHAGETFDLPHDYQTKDVSKKVVRIIQSYTDFVNRVVWSKPRVG